MTIQEERELVDHPEFYAMYYEGKDELLPLLHDWCLDRGAYVLALCIRSHYQPIRCAKKGYTYSTTKGFGTVHVDEMFLFCKDFINCLACLYWWADFQEKQ